MNSFSTKYIAIIGPTASGKSSLAMKLARLLAGEIVSCDSVQVYRGFDIGSAKPSKEEQDEVKHHLIDCIDYTCEFDASVYVEKAKTAILDINRRGKLPIIVGGTGLYLRALQQDKFHNLPNNFELRKHLKTLSNQDIYNELLEKDPQRAKQIHINDHFRLARSLEVVTLTGKTFSTLVQEQECLSASNYKPFLTILISPSRSSLHLVIAKRAKEMLASSFVEEVKELLNSGCKLDSKPMQAIGYKQVCDFLQDKIPQAELLDRIIYATRQYAKRQCTLLKKVSYDIKITNKEEILPLIPKIKELILENNNT